jgi:uncharacterized metal-binding protein YceD (DUF177 family)
MTRHPHDARFSTPAAAAARAKLEARAHDRAPRHARVRTGADGKATVDLRISVDDLESGPERLQETLPAAFVDELLNDGRELRFRAREPAQVDMMFEHEGVFVRAKGKVVVPVEHVCVRCLETVQFPLSLSLSFRLAQREQEAPDEDQEAFEDGALIEVDDVDIVSYQAGTIDFGEVLREQVFLELPPHPSCDSPGAVAAKSCAYAAEQAKAALAPKPVDPRWAALAALRDKLPATASTPLSPSPAKVAKPRPVPAMATHQPATTLPTEAISTPAPKSASKPTSMTTATKPAKKVPQKKPTKKVAKKAVKKTAKNIAKKPAKKVAGKTSTKKATKKPAKKAAAKKAPAKKATRKRLEKPRRSR